MTFKTLNSEVRPGQRKSGQVVIKIVVGTSRWVAGKARIAVMDIALHPFMLIAGLSSHVASRTGKD